MAFDTKIMMKRFKDKNVLVLANRRYYSELPQHTKNSFCNRACLSKYLNINTPTPIDMMPDKAIKIFKALGEETRFLIIQALLKKELCACEIPPIIKRTQSNTSMHLSKLQNLGLIKSRRDGKSILYSVNDKDIIKIMGLIK